VTKIVTLSAKALPRSVAASDKNCHYRSGPTA